MTPVQRPTSPHLTIYRKQLTSVLSISHRFTGIALYGGALLVAAWLWVAAYMPSWYGRLHECLSSPMGQVCLWGWVLAFYYHLFNGLRHLVWDTGHWMEIRCAERAGILVLLLTALSVAATWAYVHHLIAF